MNGRGGPPTPAAGPPAGVRTIPPGPALSAARVVLIRHGEAACAVDGVVGGHRGCTGLSDVGRVQAAALGRRLARTGELRDASVLYTSVLPRAVETAAVVCEALGADAPARRADCDLCELHPGEADGLTWPEFSSRFGAPDWDVDPGAPIAPGGESWTGFVSRASGAVAAVAARHPGRLSVIVAHAGVIEATLATFLGVDPGRGRLGLRTTNTSLTEWELGGGRWRLLRYNDAAHLLAGSDCGGRPTQPV